MHEAHDPEDAAERLENAFIEGFRIASDKQAFLRLSQIPFDLTHLGDSGLKLVAVRVEEEWTVGTVSPSFGSTELTHHPLPAGMTKRVARVILDYVSMTEHRTIRLVELIHQH